MMTRKILAIVTVICITVFGVPSTPSYVQAQGILGRPKIGLVLGGGGARGTAHAGVLKVLEENRIPIDYIAGTSMGSIVGALYASGYSPEEIHQVAEDIDWRDIFIDRPSEKYIPFHNKGENTRLARLKIGFKDKEISLPQGLVEGRKLNFELRRLYFHVSDVKHFDDLSIPFRCVSTNIVDGKEVVFEDGDLSTAVRASMAVPGALAPVHVDDKLLVDGMVVKNVPVDIVKHMGADIVIVVDVGVPLLEHDEIENLIDITNQMFGLLFKVNVKEQLDLLTDEDVLIKPDLGKNSTSDFSKVMENIDIGEAAAREHVESLKRYSVSEKEFEKYLQTQRVQKKDRLKIDTVEKKVGSDLPQRRIEDIIGTDLVGSLTYDSIKEELLKIYGLGLAKWVDYRIEKRAGQDALVLDAHEREWDKNFFRFGLNLQDDFDNSAEYQLILDYTMTELNKLGGEWETAIGLGSVQGVFSEFYQPLDYKNRFFVSPTFTATRSNIGLYGLSGERGSSYRAVQAIGQLDTGINLGTYAQLRVGVNKGVFDRRPFYSQLTTPSHTVDKGAFTSSIEYNTLDDFNFPKSGLRTGAKLSIEHEILGADEDYNKFNFNVVKPFTYKNHTLLCAFNGGTFIGNDPFFDGFTTGGLFNLSGYGQDQLGGYHQGIGRLIYYYNLKEFALTSGLHIGSSLEYGNVWRKRSDIDLNDGLWAGSVFLGLDTFIGPLYFGYGIADEKTDDGEFYVILGRPF